MAFSITLPIRDERMILERWVKKAFRKQIIDDGFQFLKVSLLLFGLFEILSELTSICYFHLDRSSKSSSIELAD